MSTTKITYRDYTDVKVSSAAKKNCYGDADNLNNRSYRDVINYAALDGTGIDLTDSALIFATADSNIGVVSTYTSGSAPVSKLTLKQEEQSVEIDFKTAISLAKGVTITPHDTLPMNVTMRMYYTDGSSYLVMDWSADVLGKTYIPLKGIAEYGSVFTSITMIFNSRSDNTQLFKIDGIDFGEDVAVSNIFGTVECYGEIDLSCIDAPYGTCDFTAEFDRTPLTGKAVYVESDAFAGTFIIDEAERQSETIYALKCNDIMSQLDNYSSQEFLTPAQIGDATGIKMYYGIGVDVYSRTNADIGGNSGDDAYWTYRQLLAMHALPQLWAFSSFGVAEGIKCIQFDADHSISRTITPDEILGRAEYKHTNSYANVTMLINAPTLVDGSVVKQDFTGSAVATVPASSLAISDTQITNHQVVRMLNLVEDYNTANMNITCANAAKYINGAEVTATVLYKGYQLGDWIRIQTPYDGIITGIIKSIQLSLSTANIAKIVIKEASA